MTSLLILLALAALAQESGDEPGEESDRRDSVAQLAPAKARQVRILVGEKQTPAVLREEPLLRWSNPTAGSVYGEIFVWTHQGRPAAIASIYRWYHPFKDSTVEVVSTCTAPLEAREGEQVMWQSKEPGIKYHPLEAAPGKSAGDRLRQMRRLAGEFKASLSDQRAGEAVTRELRLLNQPLHRYASPEQGVVDGAVFALVESTDPEVWVIVEAVEKEGRRSWQYALARMNSDACQVRLAGKVVQEWDRIADPWRNKVAPYITWGFKPEDVKLETSPK